MFQRLCMDANSALGGNIWPPVCQVLHNVDELVAKFASRRFGPEQLRGVFFIFLRKSNYLLVAGNEVDMNVNQRGFVFQNNELKDAKVDHEAEGFSRNLPPKLLHSIFDPYENVDQCSLKTITIV